MAYRGGVYFGFLSGSYHDFIWERVMDPLAKPRPTGTAMATHGLRGISLRKTMGMLKC